ncbi:hypothetical protein M378DRAFT_624376 [Amanita muscaria Koide BX008]|uniref:Uncharacterized protein n=1 Tax=Amanita muscaria (strain Koide BX008) TaxID=946122 RepID=A0A0C2XLP8_AMAMK|nr:hypothetical protein M378DRAFT_624376 [Amanita muscaria Koide BX008]
MWDATMPGDKNRTSCSRDADHNLCLAPDTRSRNALKKKPFGLRQHSKDVGTLSKLSSPSFLLWSVVITGKSLILTPKDWCMDVSVHSRSCRTARQRIIGFASP